MATEIVRVEGLLDILTETIESLACVANLCGLQHKVTKKSKYAKTVKLKLMNYPTRSDEFPVDASPLINSCIIKSMADKTTTTVNVTRHPLTQAGSRYFIVEIDVNVVHYCLKYLRQTTRVPTEDIACHVCEWHALCHVMQVH